MFEQKTQIVLYVLNNLEFTHHLPLKFKVIFPFIFSLDTNATFFLIQFQKT